MESTSTLEGAVPSRSDNLTVMAHFIYLMYVLPTGITAIFGLIAAYACIGQARGTYLHSHFRWQVRTFWIVLAVTLLVGGIALAVVGGMVHLFSDSTVGIVFTAFVGYLFFCLFLLLSLWFLYRTVKGWYFLFKEREI
ncbi:MAG: transrane protein [Ramlibacter sp.]|nr:transrane protein [Ramlibacter sp.]